MYLHLNSSINKSQIYIEHKHILLQAHGSKILATVDFDFFIFSTSQLAVRQGTYNQLS